jgi:hypothetical protein
VVWTGHFEKFLKIVLRLPHLALEITFGGCDILLAGVISFIIIAIIIGRNGNVLGVLLLPLLPALGVLSSTLDGGLGWCGSTTVGGRFHVAHDEGGPNHLLMRHVE